MRRGIIETFGLAGSVLFAAPVALYGAQRLLDGATAFGAAFLVVAVLMIVVPRLVITPGDLAGSAAERVVGRVVKVDDEE